MTDLFAKLKIGFEAVVTWLWRLFVVAIVFVALYILMQIFLVTSFSIPSDSMSPALLAGDKVLVKKWQIGARIFDLQDALEHRPLNISRLRGTQDISYNDVLIFNFPYPERWDSIGFDVMKYYVKRCIALPGDTVEIRNAHYMVRGYHGLLGNKKWQDSFGHLMRDEKGIEQVIKSNCYYTYPFDSLLNWNVKEFGPLYVPCRGVSVPLNRSSVVLYKRLIEWEQRAKLKEENGRYYLDGKEIHDYSFLKNYYFLAGDNVYNSRDSRYWGVLPEEYIAGKAAAVWKSVDVNMDTVRWDRIWKKIE